MSRRFEKQVVLVTGAGSGIGREAALLFASEGAHVVAVAQCVDEGERTVQVIWDSGGTGIFIHADVSRAADCRFMVEEAEAVFGGLDIAFNDAGVFLSMHYEIPALLRRGGGAIVNHASGGALRTPPTQGIGVITLAHVAEAEEVARAALLLQSLAPTALSGARSFGRASASSNQRMR